MVNVSRNSGTFFNRYLPYTIIVAAIMGKTAFFAPLIETDPDRGFFPSMIILSIMHLSWLTQKIGHCKPVFFHSLLKNRRIRTFCHFELIFQRVSDGLLY